MKLLVAVAAIAFAVPLFAAQSDDEPLANLKAPGESQIWGDTKPDNGSQTDPRPADNSALRLIEKINSRLDLIQEVNDRQDARLNDVESRLAELESRFSRSNSQSYSGGNGSTGSAVANGGSTGTVTRVYRSSPVTQTYSAPNMVNVNGQWVAQGIVSAPVIVHQSQPVFSRSVQQSDCPGGNCNASRTVTRSYTPLFSPRRLSNGYR